MVGLRTATHGFKTTITAPRFDCDFFPTGNNVKACQGGPKGKVTRERTVPDEGRGTQYLTADKLSADERKKFEIAEPVVAAEEPKKEAPKVVNASEEVKGTEGIVAIQASDLKGRITSE